MFEFFQGGGDGGGSTTNIDTVARAAAVQAKAVADALKKTDFVSILTPF